MWNVLLLRHFRLLGVAMILGSWAAPCFAYTRNYDSDSGYVASVAGEREEDLQDMVVLEPPSAVGINLHDRIFNDKLTKEFTDRYQQQFGHTEAQQQYYASNKFTYYEDSYGFRGTIIDADNQRRQFGEYMVRRLVEYHAENYAKSDPSTKAMWEAKDRVSNMNVSTPNFKFNFSYEIASNTFDIKQDGRWLDSRVILQMPAGHFGPGAVQETTFALGKNVSKTVRVESHYAMVDGIVSLIGRKQLSSTLSTSLIASTFTHPGGTSTRESLYLGGLSYVF